MIIGAVKEKKKFENRVSISPDDVKNYVKAGHQVFIEKGAGSLSGFNDKELGLDFLSRSGDMQISRLRLKLKKECNLNDIIRSVHGKGYKIFI